MKKEFTNILKSFNANHPSHNVKRENEYWPISNDEHVQVDYRTMVMTPVSMSETSKSDLESYRVDASKLLPESKLDEGRLTMPENKLNLSLGLELRQI